MSQALLSIMIKFSIVILPLEKGLKKTMKIKVLIRWYN